MRPKVARFDTNEEPIDGYVLVDYLGQGQFGEVWKARDKASGKLVAIKIIDLTHSPTALKELRAFKLVKNLNHPNLIPIFTARLKNRRDREVDFDKADTLPKGDLKELVIAMGLGEKSLSARLKELNRDDALPHQRTGIPVGELIRYFRGAAKGIDFLNQQDHGQGAGDGPIVHCDIKPENLMIVSGEVQIADCGVAVIITPDVRKTQAAGSPAYSAPELSANKPVQGTDQYSLAISYYELRTGMLPFPEDAGLQQIFLAHALGDLDFSSPIISEGEREILRRATARVASQRYEACEDFVEDLALLPEIRAQIRSGRKGGSSRSDMSGKSFDLVELEAGSSHDSGPVGPVTGTPNAGATPQDYAKTTPVGPAGIPGSLPVSAEKAQGSIPADQEPAPPAAAPSPYSTIAPGQDLGFNLDDLPPASSYNPTPELMFPPQRKVESPIELKAERSPGQDAPPASPPAGTPERPPASPGVGGMLVDPSDPLGKKYQTAEPDSVIQQIIQESQRVKTEDMTRRPAPPPRSEAPPAWQAPPPPLAPPQHKPESPRPKAPPRAPLPTETMVPANDSESLAGNAQTLERPIPDWAKGTPGAQASTAGAAAPATDWKERPGTSSGGGSGKVLGLIAAGIIGVAGASAGLYFGVLKDSTPTPDPIAGGDGGGGAGRGGEEIPPDFNEAEANVKLKDLLAANDFPGANTFLEDRRKENAPQPWLDQARTEIQTAQSRHAMAEEQRDLEPIRTLLAKPDATEADLAKARADIATLPSKYLDRQPEYRDKLTKMEERVRESTFTKVWKPIEATITEKQPADSVEVKLKEGIKSLNTEFARELVPRLAKATVVAYRSAYQGEQELPLVDRPRQWGRVATVLRSQTPFMELDLDDQQAIARWQATDLLHVLNDAPTTLFRELAPASMGNTPITDPSEESIANALKAVENWLSALDQAQTAYGNAWPKEAFNQGRPRLFKQWHTTASRGGEDSEQLNALFTLASQPNTSGDPVDATVIALEYFRLAPDREAISRLRSIRDAIRTPTANIPEPRQKQVESRFQYRLAKHVRTLLSAPTPDYARIATDAGSDTGLGWARAASLEQILQGKPTPEALKTLTQELQTIDQNRVKEDTELKQYVSYLKGLAESQQGRWGEPTAALVMQAYPDGQATGVLSHSQRKGSAANVLNGCVAQSMKIVISSTPRVELNTNLASNWVTTTARIDKANDQSQMMECILAYAKQDTETIRRLTQQIPTSVEIAYASRPDLGFVYRVARASIGNNRFQMTEYSKSLPFLIQWYDQENASLVRRRYSDAQSIEGNSLQDAEYNQKRNELRDIVDKITSEWRTIANNVIGSNPKSADPTIQIPYAQYLLNSAGFLSRFPVTFEKRMELAGQDARLAIELLKSVRPSQVTAEDFAMAAYVEYQRLEGDLYNDFVKTESSPPEDKTINCWAQTFEYLDEALKLDPDNGMANRVIGEVCYRLMTSPEENKFRYQRVHEAVQKNSSNRRLLDIDSTNTQRLLEQLDRSLKIAIQNSTRVFESELWYYRAHARFYATTREALRGANIKDIQSSFALVVEYCQQANANLHYQKYLVDYLSGLAQEDIAWMTVPESEMEFRSAISSIGNAIKLVQSDSKFGVSPSKAPAFVARYSTDLGRTQYRAAAYGKPGIFPMTDAITTLKAALADATSSNRLYEVAESNYWLGHAYVAQKQYREGFAAWRSAEKAADAASTSYTTLALYARARYACINILTSSSNRQMFIDELASTQTELDEYLKANPKANILESHKDFITITSKAIPNFNADGLQQLVTLADTFERRHLNEPNRLNQSPLHSNSEYVHLAALILQAKESSQLELDRAVLRKFAGILQQTWRDYPWIFPIEERKTLQKLVEKWA